MIKTVTTSAPGKLMLFGEHAVVYGEPCIVTAVDERLEVTVSEAEAETPNIDAPQVKDTRFVEEALKVFAETQNVKISHLRISTRSPFSGKFGFGSSSAVTVATLKALNQYYEKHMSERALFDMAYQVVLEVQGVGSGFDVAAGVYGGTLYFKKGGVTIQPLQLVSLPLVVGYSGVKSNTVEMVNQVAEKRKQERDKFDRLMKAIGVLTEQTLDPLQQADWERVGRLMDGSHEYLRDLGVSCEKLENLISAAKSSGALGAKLSGAGGGDCMIALASSEKREDVELAITQAGGIVLHVATNASGVRIEI